MCWVHWNAFEQGFAGKREYRVIGVDNLNDYYDVRLKNDRLMILKKYDHFNFIKLDISNKDAIEKCFRSNSIDKVVNLFDSSRSKV